MFNFASKLSVCLELGQLRNLFTIIQNHPIIQRNNFIYSEQEMHLQEWDSKGSPLIENPSTCLYIFELKKKN